MKVRTVPATLLAGMLMALPLASADAEKSSTAAKQETPAVSTAPEFRVGPGDVLRIDVWKEQEVSSTVTIRPDGRISLPLTKDIDVNNLTPIEIQKVLTAELGKFLSSPDVTVIVQQINSKKIYVMGQVSRAGSLVMVSPMTIVQALSEAGGPTEYANTKRVLVLRNDAGKQTRFTFNYKDFLKGDSAPGNIELKPGDTIVVP